MIVDRGMANDENLATIRKAGYHWLVAARRPERVCYFEQFEDQAGWRNHPGAFAAQWRPTQNARAA